ncbi:hypothetical protein B4U27_31780 [Klebsiella pneumoniae]|nr:hypothetical protein B4U27_31780 [Klebsiella pneumoniae]
MHTNNIISGTPQAHIPQARQAQRRRGGHHRCHTRLCAGWRLRLIRPTGSSRKSLYNFAGRSPGVQGAAATGRPLCAPCAMPGITQTINRERNVR